jgi:hypothetical protein
MIMMIVITVELPSSFSAVRSADLVVHSQAPYLSLVVPAPPSSSLPRPCRPQPRASLPLPRGPCLSLLVPTSPSSSLPLRGRVICFCWRAIILPSSSRLLVAVELPLLSCFVICGSCEVSCRAAELAFLRGWHRFCCCECVAGMRSPTTARGGYVA